MAPGGFDLESFTAFFEPSTPLKAFVVLELEFFVAPDERGTGLRARIGSSSKESMSHKNKKTYGSGNVSQPPVPIPPDIDEEYDRYWYSSRDVEGQ